MKKDKKAISELISLIKEDIKKDVLEKYGLGDFYIGTISFKRDGGCQDGFEEVCKYYGKDAKGKPIIVCKCIPKRQ